MSSRRLWRQVRARPRCSFFFQAEDGIRDYKVTGVQTCALPIYLGYPLALLAIGLQILFQGRGPKRLQAVDFVFSHLKAGQLVAMRSVARVQGIARDRESVG